MNEIAHVEGIVKTFSTGQSEVKALNGISLTLSAGTFMAIRGASGCGKTTLLLTAGGLLRPDTGQVVIMNQPLYEMPVEQRAAFRAAHIGFVFQQFHLIPYLTVLENIRVPLLKDKGNTGIAHAQALLQHFNLAGHAHKLPAQLSTGERQRVALARALMNRPKLLLADEPTGNLDEDNADIALNALSDFAREGGAVLLVTHDRNAAECADTILEMQSGSFLKHASSDKETK